MLTEVLLNLLILLEFILEVFRHIEAFDDACSYSLKDLVDRPGLMSGVGFYK